MNRSVKNCCSQQAQELAVKQGKSLLEKLQGGSKAEVKLGHRAERDSCETWFSGYGFGAANIPG